MVGLRPRVLLVGSGGQLGRVLAGVLAGQYELEALSRAELDLADADAVRAAVRGAFGKVGPEIVVNAAAYTAVDRAEQEPELARAVNAAGPGVMAEEMRRLGGWLVHYSTDYVFDGSGTRPWRESDATGPLSVYGQTKLEGEQAIAAAGCRHVVLRTSWVYAAVGRNFLHTMLKLGREREQLRVVDDQVGAPTSAEAIAAGTGEILQALGTGTHAGGVYHLTCGGETSWAGFARAIFGAFAARQKAPEVVPIPTEAYPTPARRPRNSRLSREKVAAEFGVRLPMWEEALAEVAATMLIEKGA
jgi:dTDP-4-dehydrorhamnose reductase